MIFVEDDGRVVSRTMHFAGDVRDTACGQVGAQHKTTGAIAKVDCGQCQRTTLFKRAVARAWAIRFSADGKAELAFLSSVRAALSAPQTPREKRDAIIALARAEERRWSA